MKCILFLSALTFAQAFLPTAYHRAPLNLDMKVGKSTNGRVVKGISLLKMNSDRIDNDDQPTKVFIANLPFALTEEELGNFCQQVGSVVDAKIILDRETGRSKGFGFVRFSEPIHATAALEHLNGKDLKGRPVRVQPAISRKPQGNYGRRNNADRFDDEDDE